MYIEDTSAIQSIRETMSHHVGKISPSMNLAVASKVGS